METVDRVLFRSRPWQMFCVIMVGWFANVFLFWNQPGWKGIAGDCLPVLFLIFWMMTLGIRLRSKLPKQYFLHFYFFIVSGLLMATAIVLIALYKSNSPELSWLKISVVVFVISVYVFFSFIARAVKFFETKGKASFADYFVDTWLWSVWVISVWIQAPRLNRIYDQFYEN